MLTTIIVTCDCSVASILVLLTWSMRVLVLASGTRGISISSNDDHHDKETGETFQPSCCGWLPGLLQARRPAMQPWRRTRARARSTRRCPPQQLSWLGRKLRNLESFQSLMPK